MKIITIAILALFSSAALSQNKVIGQITSTYDSNQARFHTQYRGLELNGVGSVRKIEADILGIGAEFVVTINSNGSNLLCLTKNKIAASKLDKGEQINFTGIIEDVLLGDLLLNNCQFTKITVRSELDEKKEFAKNITKPCKSIIDSKSFGLHNYFYSKDHQLLAFYEPNSPVFGTISWINFNTLEFGHTHRNNYKELVFDGKHHRKKWDGKYGFYIDFYIDIDEDSQRCLFSNNFTFSDEFGKTTCNISGKVFTCKWSKYNWSKHNLIN